MDRIDGEGLADLVRRGGFFDGIEGTAPREVITHLIAALRQPEGFERGRLLNAVLEREELMPTGIGHGIALPHPRNPPVTEISGQFVAVAFLKQPVDWLALDGEPVHTVILIVSASAKLHLHTLSRINFFCQGEDFRGLLRKRAAPEEIIKRIGDAEASWS